MFGIIISSVSILSLLLSFSAAVRLPPNFEKCNRKQADFKECVLRATQKAVPQLIQPFPELHLPSINPFVISKIEIGQGKSAVAVEQKFQDCKFYGFHEAKIHQFEFDFDRKFLNATVTFPKLVLKCQYELDGKVLLLPIKGNGPATVTLAKLYCDAHFKYEEQKKKNKTYLKFISNDLDLNPELVIFDFENLLSDSGNEELGKNVNQVLNDNWKVIFEDVKSGYVEVVNQILLTLMNNFFARVSLEEAID